MGKALILPKEFHPDFAFPNKKPVGPVEIDWSSPLTKNLVEVFTLAGTPRGLIHNPAITVSSPTTPFVPRYGEMGLVPATTTTNKYSTTDARIRDLPLSPFSILYRAYAIGSNVNNGGLLGWYGTDDIIFYPNDGNGDTAKHRVFWRDASITLYDSDNVMSGWYNFCLVWDGANVYQYINGVKQAASASYNGTGAGPFTGFGLNWWPDGQYYSSSGHVSYIMLWDAPLSDAAAKSVTKTPKQVLAPLNQTTYFIPSAGGGIALSVNSLSQGQSFGSPALTQHSALTANDIAQGQQLDQPVLTQHYILSTDDMTQTEVLGIPTLTQAHILSVEALSQAQSLSQPGLTQHHVLAANALSQSQVLGNVTLTIADAISPASLSQSQLFDAPTLTQHHVLSVAGLAQTNTLGNVLLTVAGTLNVSDLEQGQTITQATLLQHHVLSVNSLLQAQSISSVTLTAAELLAVAGMAQAQAIESPGLTQHGILSVGDLTQEQILQIVSLGGAVIGRLDGRVVICSALSGRVNIAPALDGKIVIN